MDIRQSTGYAKYLKSQGWIVERKNGINYFLKKVPILGYILKIQRPKKIDYQYIDVLVAKYKPYLVSIEPNNNKDLDLLISNAYKLSTSPFLPTKTLQIDLTKSVQKITADFKKETKRQILRGSKLKSKIYSTPNEIELFQKAWRNSVNFSRNVATVDQLINLQTSFGLNNTLFLASHNIINEIIGGAVFTISRERNDTVCYYWHAFTNKKGRCSLSQYSLVQKGLLWAKKMGCKVFDFEGIYDDRFPKKDWLGFSHFKKSFGGYEVPYPGCYTKYILKNVFSTKTPTPSI